MRIHNYTRAEQKQNQEKKVAQALAGKGLYVYENKLKADLTLPKPTHSGLRQVKAGAKFQGDDYYLQMVKTGELKLIEVLDRGEPPVMENKLILDQPEMVTTEGTVELVQKQNAKKKKLKESVSNEKTDPVLLVEEPTGHLETI